MFAQCHALAPPQHYYEACLFDSCYVPGSNLECASLQTYAALCAQEGICVDWRNHTGGACRECLPAPSDAQRESWLGWGARPPEDRLCYAPVGLGPCLLARDSMRG